MVWGISMDGENIFRLLENHRETLHPIGVSIPISLKEKFDFAVMVDGRSKRRILAELIGRYCDEILPKNFDEIKNLLTHVCDKVNKN
jgi:hypothetical protein